MSWSDAWNMALKKGFKIVFKKDWFGEKDLPDAKHPANIKRTDAMDDIAKSMNKKYTCNTCNKDKSLHYICKCKKCKEYVCSSCYTLIKGEAWCKECLTNRKKKN